MDLDFHYAGFWERFGAGVIDTLVHLPFIFLFYWGYSESRSIALLLTLTLFVLFSLYLLYFHARWGQTIGKMVIKIKVLRVDGTPIGWKESLLRHSIDLFLATLQTVGQIIALLAVSEAAFSAGHANGFFSKEYWEFQAALDSFDPMPSWLSIVSEVWIWSEMLFLLLNKQKRALHDLIAGTIVVCGKPDSSGQFVPEKIPAEPI